MRRAFSAFLLLAPLCLLPSPASAVDGFWTVPVMRFYKSGAACAYDSDNHRLLVMGGHSFSAGQASDQLWAFDVDGGTSWSVLPPGGVTPGTRAGANMLFDAPRHRLLVFGGHRVETGEYLGDLWARRLDGDYPWELLNDGAGGPGARKDACLAIDTGRNQLVLFGGEGAGGLLNDAWVLPLSGSPVWTQLAPTGTPPTARSLAQMAYDPPRNRVVIVGGYTPTKVYDVQALSLAGSPGWSASSNPAMPLGDTGGDNTGVLSYDETSDVMRLVGWSSSNSVAAQTLQLSPSFAWTNTSTGGVKPIARHNHLVAHDPVGHRDILYGGYVEYTPSYYSTEVYALTGNFGGSPSWSRIDFPANMPPRSRAGGALVYDAPLNRIFVLGGVGRGETAPFLGGPSNEAYKLTVDPVGRWSNRITGDVRRVDFALAHDLTRNRIIQIGGKNYTGTSTFSNVVSFNINSEVWAALTPTGAFPAVAGPRAVYDAPRDRVVVFAPEPGTLWELPFAVSALSPPWTPITPSNAGPSGRTGVMVVRDPVRDRMLVLGGTPLASGQLDEMWALSLSGPPEWTQIPLAGPSPSERSNGVLVYDSNRDRLVLYGGKAPGGQLHTDAWTLPLGGSNQWAELSLSGPAPSARDFPAGAFDPDLDRVVIWGGDTANVVPMDALGDLHFIQFAEWLAVTPSTPGATLAFTAGPNPAREGVAIRLARPAAANTRVTVHDLAGRVLREATLPEGALEWRWDGAAPPGVYFVRLAAGRESAIRRVVRLN